ncbi:hypothetical protein R0G64_04770 [Pseudomonas otitidis]|uniref:Uncharacterized protein n=1 Tax=Metapseudomonas otitidis TaxID=319939 RepID=A0ABU3XMZ5_9GAMM|nr:hypothetical protein [Pseudomonas otitidis]MDV3438738.1 hypothetical protein [Pseudomonas otitidis]MDV3438745.1 hypothetical protein [Pseudomonas otitidis]
MDRTLLANPTALLAHFSQWYANVDIPLFSPTGEPVNLGKWQPVRVTVNDNQDLVAILAETGEYGEYQRADLYDVPAQRFICMREASLYDASPIFDLRFAPGPGRIDFVFDEFDHAQPTQRKFWPGGYSVKRGEWLMPSAADLDLTPVRPLSAAALARHPRFASLSRHPRIVAGPIADFAVHHWFERDVTTGDFFAYVSIHGDNEDYVGRIDGITGELIWKAPMASYDNYQRVGNWVVTNSGVHQANDGKKVCSFTGDPEFTPREHRVLLAPDESLWLSTNLDEAPGHYLRAVPATGEVEQLQLSYLRLIDAGALWLGCTQSPEGVVTLHGLSAPDHGELAAPLWSRTPPADIGDAVLDLYFCTVRPADEQRFVGVDKNRWWILELATGESWDGTLDDGARAHSLQCIEQNRAYFSASHDTGQTLNWLDLTTHEIARIPLPPADWQSVHVERDVLYAIENLGGNNVTRHVPVAYELTTGERLWEGVHTRLCNLIVPTPTGVAVGGSIGELYWFEQ